MKVWRQHPHLQLLPTRGRRVSGASRFLSSFISSLPPLRLRHLHRCRSGAGLPVHPAGAQSRSGHHRGARAGRPGAAQPARRLRGPASGPPRSRTLCHLPVRRRGARGQQGGPRRTRHRGRPHVRRQPLPPEALLSRHPGGRRGRSRQPRRRRCGRYPVERRLLAAADSGQPAEDGDLCLACGCHSPSSSA